MSEIALARINSFLLSEQQADFPVSPTIAVPVQVLQDLLETIQGLKDEVAQLREERNKDCSKLTSLEFLQEQEISRICLDIAYDRKRLAALEHPKKEPGKTETSRAEKIRRYLLSRPDHRATFETLKGYLGVDNVLLNQAIKTLMDNSSGMYGITRTPGDKRKRTIVMLPK